MSLLKAEKAVWRWWGMVWQMEEQCKTMNILTLFGVNPSEVVRCWMTKNLVWERRPVGVVWQA